MEIKSCKMARQAESRTLLFSAPLARTPIWVTALPPSLARRPTNLSRIWSLKPSTYDVQELLKSASQYDIVKWDLNEPTPA
jgi:hypothetical protein